MDIHYPFRKFHSRLLKSEYLHPIVLCPGPFHRQDQNNQNDNPYNSFTIARYKQGFTGSSSEALDIERCHSSSDQLTKRRKIEPSLRQFHIRHIAIVEIKSINLPPCQYDWI